MYVEEWKPIKGYEEIYEISNWGNIRGLNCNGCKTAPKTTKVLTPKKLKNGRRKIGLYKDHKVKYYYVYRLVWEAFNGPIEKGLVINHLDENPSNDRLDNLEKCTQKENMNYGTLQERKASKRRKSVKQLTKDGKLVKVWESVTSAAKAFNGYHYNIIQSINKGYSAYGYKWEYLCI